MKKILIITIIATLTGVIPAAAQVEQGRWFVKGGSDMTFNAGASKTRTDGTTRVNSRFAAFSFQTAVGYTVIDNFPVGLMMDFSVSTTRDPDDDVRFTETLFAIGPFARYYFADLGSFRPYGELAMGIGNYHTGYSPGVTNNELYLLFRLGPGFSVFFNDHVALDLFLGFQNDLYRDRDAGDPPDEVVRYYYPKFVSSLGIIVML